MIGWILFTSTALAADLNWSDCVRLAQKNNMELRGAQSQVLAGENGEGVARSGYFPQLNANLGYLRGSDPLASNYTAGLTANQNIFAGLLDRAKTQQAEANTQATLEAYQTTRARISYELKNAFQGLLYAQEYRGLSQEIIRRRSENLRLVALRFQSGRENKGSVFLSEAYLEQSRYDDLQAENAQKVSATQLAEALSWEEEILPGIEGSIPLEEPSSETPDLKQIALETPEYRQSIYQEQAAQAGTTIARAPFFPSLNLVGTLGRQASSFFPEGPDRWSLGINLSFSLLSGGKDFYSVRASTASWVSADSHKTSILQQTMTKLQSSYAAFKEAVAKLKMDERFRQAALTRAEIARSRYNNGLMTFEDWDLIENDLIVRQKTYLQSKRDRVTAQAAWEQAQGKGAIP